MRPDPQGWDLATRAGHRSPVLAWRVKTAAGEVMELSSLQRAALLWIRGQVGRGHHHWKVVDLARALDCGRGTASKILRRLRSLSLIGAHRAVRGRVGGIHVWLPTKASALREAAARGVRWPTRSNDSTLTTFGGFLSREGLKTAWSAMRGGRPPGSAGPPPRGAAGLSPRARGRPWPPTYVDEPCPSRRGARGRLGILAIDRSGPDVALVYGGRCPRCRRVHLAPLVLVAPRPSRGLERAVLRIEPGSPTPVLVEAEPPTPTAAQVAAARDLVNRVDRRQADELRIQYLGYHRQPLHEPILPALVDGPLEQLDELVDVTRRRCRAELEIVARSRELVPPAAATIPTGAPGG